MKECLWIFHFTKPRRVLCAAFYTTRHVNIGCIVKNALGLHRRTTSLKEKSQKQDSGETLFIHGSSPDSVFLLRLLNRSVLVNSSSPRNTEPGDMTTRRKSVNMEIDILIPSTKIKCPAGTMSQL